MINPERCKAIIEYCEIQKASPEEGKQCVGRMVYSCSQQGCPLSMSEANVLPRDFYGKSDDPEEACNDTYKQMLALLNKYCVRDANPSLWTVESDEL